MSEHDSAPGPLMQVRGLTAGYSGSRVLFGVSFDVPTSGTVAVVGRNGAGKTTLLRSIMGFHQPTSGAVLLDGQDVTRSSPSQKVRRGVGYVPQEFVVFPDLTVRENLQVGLSAAPRARRAGIDAALDLFPKLGDRLGQKAGTMSGGERKMVGIARALLGQPRLLVMDEPTEGVWHGVVDEIAARLKEYSRDNAVLLVEQHLEFALSLADHVVVLERGEVKAAGAARDVAGDADLRRQLAL